jgi:hypothetical protein
MSRRGISSTVPPEDILCRPASLSPVGQTYFTEPALAGRPFFPARAINFVSNLRILGNNGRP